MDFKGISQHLWVILSCAWLTMKWLRFTYIPMIRDWRSSSALTYGSLSRIKIDNMREEHQEKLIKDAEKIAAQQAEEAAKAPKKEVGFISVSIGEGFGRDFP